MIRAGKGGGVGVCLLYSFLLLRIEYVRHLTMF